MQSVVDAFKTQHIGSDAPDKGSVSCEYKLNPPGFSVAKQARAVFKVSGSFRFRVDPKIPEFYWVKLELSSGIDGKHGRAFMARCRSISLRNEILRCGGVRTAMSHRPSMEMAMIQAHQTSHQQKTPNK